MKIMNYKLWYAKTALMAVFAFCLSVSSFAFCSAVAVYEKMPALQFQTMFMMKGKTIQDVVLNAELAKSCNSLDKVWKEVPSYKKRNELKKTLDLIFRDMHDKTKLFSPNQENKLWSLETQTRLAFYDCHKALKAGLKISYLNECLNRLSK